MQDFRMATFLSVCRTLNYTHSAELLNITQPAVSQHIAFLEKTYGVKLFTYEKKKLQPTPAGELLRNAASVASHDELLLRDRLAALAGTTSTIRIGMTLTAGEYLVAQPLARYLIENPSVRARITSADTARLIELLYEGEIDCALVEGVFDKSAFSEHTFSTEELIAVCSPDSPLAHRAEPISLKELVGQHVLVRESGSGTRAVLEHALAEHNLSIESFARVTEIESINIIKTFAREGYGIAFLYEAALGRELNEKTLVRIRLAGQPIRHDMTFISLKNSVFEKDFAQLFADLQTQKTRDQSAKKDRSA